MTRRTFGREELDAALREIGLQLGHVVNCYLIGGCAMTFRGQKLATKDIDLVVVGQRELKRLVSAMEKAGFVKVPSLEKEYRGLGARAVMENPAGMRFDLFDKVVCRKLRLSEAMRSRSARYGTFRKLRVRLTAPEDIFLFKGVTDRSGDLDDMSVLAVAGLKWQVIKKECLSQESGRNWASRLVAQLENLRDDYDIEAPITGELREWAQVLAAGQALLRFLRGKSRSFDEIRDHFKANYGFEVEDTEAELGRLVEFGILEMKRRSGKRYYRKAS